MQNEEMTVIHGAIVEDNVLFTLVELCQACNVEEEHVLAWVFEGVLEPIGDSPGEWRFSGDCLRRARMAWRLTNDLDINPSGVALALDLLDEIAQLRAQLQCGDFQS